MLVVVQEVLQMVLCWAALGAAGVFLVQAQQLQETSTPVAVVAVVCQIQI
jgi:thiamine transporter ThiT